MFQHEYAQRLRRRRELAGHAGSHAATSIVWDETSTYIKKPPYFDDMADPGDVGHGSSAACACWRCWAIP